MSECVDKNLRLVPQLHHVRLYCIGFDSVYVHVQYIHLLARRYAVPLQVFHFQIVPIQTYLVSYCTCFDFPYWQVWRKYVSAKYACQYWLLFVLYVQRTQSDCLLPPSSQLVPESNGDHGHPRFHRSYDTTPSQNLDVVSGCVWMISCATLQNCTELKPGVNRSCRTQLA